MRSRALVLVIAIVLVATPAWAQLDELLKGLGIGRQGSLSEAKVGAGLKEALHVATENSVDLTGRLDGYFGNEAIKILMPEKLRTVEQGLRVVGYGEKVDEFVLSMNRAAERAAPAAKQIFWDAIGAMTFDDAQKILGGGDTAATEFLERTMSQVGVVRQYQELVGRFKAIPFAQAQTFDINGYVVTKALDGLFHVIGEQERQIRTNPAARTTALLKEVFAKR